MIGQEDLQNLIETQIKNDTFPHFSIIVGNKGSGKKTLVNKIFDYFMIYKDFTSKYTLFDIKVDNVREMITDVYKSHNTLYVILDADTMSINAKNSLLKVVEECPNNNYFIMTLQDKNNTLETIRSRGSVYEMQPYTKSQLEEYALNITNNKDEIDKLISICENFGEIETLATIGINKFYNYVETVIENIATVSGANAFKIADKIALKDEKDKYDLKLFLKTFANLCLAKEIEMFEIKDLESAEMYSNAVVITLSTLRDLKVRAINKTMLFDKWILLIREVWL